MVKNRIRELREENNLTLKGLSDGLKSKGHPLSASSLIKYERGERNPSLETWENLAKFFNVPVSYLQGQGPSVEKAKSQIISILHNRYFEGSGMMDDEVDGFLKATNTKETPFDFYGDDETDYELTDKIKVFWNRHFAFIFNYPEIIDICVNFDLYSEDEIAERIQNVIRTEWLKQLPKSNAWKIFNAKYSDQLLKAEMSLNSAVRLGTKSDVKNAITNYEKILNNLKRDLI